MRISWRSPIASSGTATAGARTVRTKIRMPFKSLSLPAFAFVLLSGANAVAAPQILGIVASNGLPTPLQCQDRYCSAYLASFCLQAARYAPNSGSDYRLAPGSRITIIAKLRDGRSLRIAGEDKVAIRTRSGFTSVRVSLPAATLAALGATSADVEVGPHATILPVTSSDDPSPQSAAEVAAAAGPLRRLAAETFDRASGMADTARLVELVINRLPPQASTTGATVAALWGEVADGARRAGVSSRSIDGAAAIVADCRSGLASDSGPSTGICLEMRQAELMTTLTRHFWDESAGGS